VTAVSAMPWWQVIVLAVVQGLTAFLPVSASGHLAIVSRIFFAGDAGASFTAVSQLGTEAAVDEIRSGVRNLWVVATALVAFSAVIALAEFLGRQSRHIEQPNWRDALVVGLAQTLALIRELAARFGFLLAIPAVFGLAAGYRVAAGGAVLTLLGNGTVAAT
jgi:undecaprenyl-diphosphatase